MEDNDSGARRENRRAATVTSRKSIVKSGSSGGSSGVARSVPRVDDRKVSSVELLYLWFALVDMYFYSEQRVIIY